MRAGQRKAVLLKKEFINRPTNRGETRGLLIVEGTPRIEPAEAGTGKGRLLRKVERKPVTRINRYNVK